MPKRAASRELIESREAWNEFLDRVCTVRRELKKAKTDFCEPWFRGLRDTEHPGVPLEPETKFRPCIWVLNPYELNARLLGVRDLYDPKILGWDKERREYWGYSEMIIEDDDGEGIDWELPVAVYPRQRTNRMPGATRMVHDPRHRFRAARG